MTVRPRSSDFRLPEPKRYKKDSEYENYFVGAKTAIAEGVYGRVRSNGYYAFKCLSPRREKHIDRRRQLAKREIRHLRNLCDIPHLVQYRSHAILNDFDRVCLVMRMAHQDLWESLKPCDRWKLTHIMVTASKHLECLSSMHERGVVHRDIKASNLTPHRILDLGIAGDLRFKDLFTQVPNALSFRPPEALLKLGYDEKVDIWAYGCVLYRLLTSKELISLNITDEKMALVEINRILPIPKAMKTRSRVSFDEHEGFFSIPLKRKIKSLRAHMEEDKARLDSVIDLLEKMLQVDPSKRISASDALKHPFFTELLTFKISSSRNRGRVTFIHKNQILDVVDLFDRTKCVHLPKGLFPLSMLVFNREGKEIQNRLFLKISPHAEIPV